MSVIWQHNLNAEQKSKTVKVLKTLKFLQEHGILNLKPKTVKKHINKEKLYFLVLPQ